MAGSILQSRESSASATGANIALAFASNNTANNKLYYVSHAGDSTSTLTISDSNTNTISAQIDLVTESVNNNRLADWEVITSKAGANTVTAAFTNTPAFRAIYIAEVQGVKNVAVDGHNGQHQTTPGTGANAVSSGNGTNSNTALKIGFMLCDSGGIQPAEGTGFSRDRLVWTYGGANDAGTVEFKSGVTAGTTAATATANGASDNFNNLMVMFDETAASFQPAWAQNATHTVIGVG